MPDQDELITRRALRSLKSAAPLAVVAAVVAFVALYVLAGAPTQLFESEGAVELTDDRAAGINTSRGRTDALQEIDARIRTLEGEAFRDKLEAALSPAAARDLEGFDADASEGIPVIVITATSRAATSAQQAVDAGIELFIADRDTDLRDSIESELIPLRSQREDQLTTINDLADELEGKRGVAAQDEISILENRTASALDRLADFDQAIQEREFLAESANGQVNVVNQAGDAVDVTASRISRPAQMAVLVLVLTLIGAVAVNRLLDRLKLLDEVRAVAGPDIPILATVPKFRSKYRTGPAALVVGKRNARREAEAFRYLRTAIEVATEQLTPVVVAFTSASPNEGKSVTSANYALAVARADRPVSLLDGDLLNSSTAKLFEADGDNAFVALMSGELDPSKENWHRIGTSGQPVDLMLSPRGVFATGRQELPAKAVEQTFEKLAELYDTIVVDCPPVLAISDAMVIARAADAAVMVVRMGRTKRRDLQTALTQLEQNKVQIAGIVITHSTDQSESYYGYGYEYGTSTD